MMLSSTLIMCLIDLPVNIWKQKLAKRADEHVIHINQYKKVKNGV